MVVGILVAWALYHPGRSDSHVPRVAPSLWAAATPATRTAATASVLWLLSIGVSHYKQSDFNLQYADVDARAVATALQRQGDGPLYAEAKTLVLTNEEVTRESILDSLGRFLAPAGANDVVAIFVAGHGVQDRASGSYYFLPFPATAENLVTTGLRMSDFDEMIRVVRRRVRGVVVMFDTCHAGALQFAPPNLLPMDEPAARLSIGEGFFLLAATKPGESSQEQSDLGHGAFTYALLDGLRGAADADKDGVLSVSDLFNYVARAVPQLTAGAQHPYDKMEGTDLPFAAVKPAGDLVEAADTLPTVARMETTGSVKPVPNTIGVVEFHNVRNDPEHDWVGQALRLAFNTELSKVRALHVYAPELIDRTAKARGTDQLFTAQQLGIDRLITGSFSVVGATILIDARIVNATSGLQEGSDSVKGDLTDFFDLQKKLVLSILRRLRVKLSAAEGSSIQNQTNTDVDAYRLLLETEEAIEASPAPQRGTPTMSGTLVQPESRREDHRWWSPIGTAYAAETESAAEIEVRQLLEEYRRALEHKDLDRLATLYVSFSEQRRDALRAYLDNAADFAVELVDVTVSSHGTDMAVSFTRRDRFIDRASGKPVRLEVRLTRIVVREDGTWKIAGRP